MPGTASRMLVMVVLVSSVATDISMSCMTLHR
jgi:hypothetical protein